MKLFGGVAQNLNSQEDSVQVAELRVCALPSTIRGVQQLELNPPGRWDIARLIGGPRYSFLGRHSRSTSIHAGNSATIEFRDFSLRGDLFVMGI